MLKESARSFYHKLRWYGGGKAAYDHILDITKKRPLDINLELVDNCPLKCCFCCNRKIKREFKYMSMELFKKICYEYVEMGGGGFGLSTMHSDVFVDPLFLDRLDYLKSIKKHLYILLTNPLVVMSKYTDEEVRFILETIDYLQVSVEGTNREDYLLMAGIDGFDSFYKNLYRVKNITDKWSIPLKIELFFRTYNLEHLHQEKVYMKLKQDFNIVQEIDTYFDWFGQIQPEDLPEGAKLSRPIHQTEKHDCAAAYSTLSIHTDGTVVGCGCIDWTGEYIIGNCNNMTLQAIWQSELAVNFRKAFSRGNIPDICKGCGLYSSIRTSYSRPALRKYVPQDGIYYSYP